MALPWWQGHHLDPGPFATGQSIRLSRQAERRSARRAEQAPRTSKISSLLEHVLVNNRATREGGTMIVNRPGLLAKASAASPR